MLLDKAEEYLDALNKLLWEENNSNEALYNSFLVESFPDVAEKKNQSNSAADFINNHIKKFGNLTRSGNDTTFFFHVNAESITKPPYFDLIQYQAAMSMMKMRQPVQAPSIATEKVAPQFVPKTNNVHYAKQIGPAVFDTTPAVQFQASRTAVSTVQANNVAMIVLIAFLIFVALIVWFVASRNQPPNRKKYKRPKRTMQETLTDIIDAIIQSQFVIAIGTVFRDPSSAAKEFRLLYKAWVEIFQDDFHPFCRSIVTESLEVLSNILMLPYRSLLSNSNNSKPQKEAAPISSTGTKPSEILTASKTKSTSNRNLNVDNSKNAVRKDKEKEKDKDKEKEKEKEKDKEKEKEKEKDKDKEKEVRDKTNEKEKEKDSKDKEKVKKHIEPAEPTNPLDFIVSQPDDENDSVVKLIELSKQIDETTSLPSKTNSTDNSDANSTISVEQLSGPSKENKNDAGLFVDSDLEPRREDIIDDMSPTRSSDENHTSIEPAFSISKEEELIDNVRRTSSASLFEGSNPAEAEMTDFVSALRNSSNDILDDHFIDKAKSHDLDELQFSLKPSEASLPAFANIESTFSLFGPNMLNHSQQSDNDSLFNLTPPRKKDSLAHLLNEREQSEFDNQANSVSDATGISLNWLQMNNTSSKPSTTQPAKTGIYRPPPLKQQQQAFSNSATLSSTTNSLGSFGKKSYSKPSTKAPYDDYNVPPEVVATNNIVKPLFANINNPTISKAPSVSRIVDGKKAVNSKKPLQSEEVGFWRRVNEDELEPTNSRAASLAMPTSTSTIDSLLFSPPPPGFSVSNDVRPIGDSRQGNFNSLNPAVNINASSINIAPQLSLSQPSTIVVVTIVATCTLLNPTITSSIKIASNIFGQWQILGAKPMRCSLANPSLWNLTIDIPRNFSYFSYKYVAIDIQKNIWVEPGPPRVINLLKVNSPTGEFLQKDKFENGIRVADEAMYLF